MCGITGFLALDSRRYAAGQDRALQRMSDSLVHRGPDDSGAWRDADAGIWLGFRRLSILDLSQAGHQPMVSHCGRYVLVFNGEIYNHLAIRRELGDPGAGGWRGHADSETLLAAFSRWGVDAALARTVGMFGFAVWDRQTRDLTLARDRLGEKPLYCGWQGDTFLFGSELKALRSHPDFVANVDRDALTLLLRHNYIAAPRTVYAGIRKLEPGTLLRVSAQAREPRITTWWSASGAVEAARQDPFRGDAAAAVDALEAVLTEAVRGQMVADVPHGAFLSGGIDSSTIVALMQSQSSQPVRTFTIGFSEPGYDEAVHAKAVAQHLGTDHTELYVSSAEARAVIPRLPALYDEPFADSSQIPTFLVAQLARTKVTVSLSGDGGDELFGGYDRYAWMKDLWRGIGWAPQFARSALAAGLGAVPAATWDRVVGALEIMVPTRYRAGGYGEKLHRLAEVLAARQPEHVYRQIVSHWNHPETVVLGGHELPTPLSDAGGPSLPELTHRLMYLDLVSYLPDDILAKVDRAAMGVSLETRVPLLDHRVVEFAWRLPLDFKVRAGQGKWVLRQVLYRHVPQALIERPKMGFGVPVGAWLRGPLRDWAESLLDESRLRREGYFDPAPIRRKWEEHVGGARNCEYHLWDVLMFQAWLEAQQVGP